MKFRTALLAIGMAGLLQSGLVFGQAGMGGASMVLSTIITERGTTVFWEEIEQKRARDDIPDVTIKRE